MTLATDLLDQAELLTRIDRRRPKQVNLQRAISAAYYALFHRLIDAATEHLIGNSKSKEARTLRNAMSRWFTHTTMKSVANVFCRAGKVPEDVRELFGVSAAEPAGIVPPELAHVARAFVDLQDARHRADYDRTAQFSRTNARDFVALAQAALTNWTKVASSPAARLFLLFLLTNTALIKTR